MHVVSLPMLLVRLNSKLDERSLRYCISTDSEIDSSMGFDFQRSISLALDIFISSAEIGRSGDNLLYTSELRQSALR